MLHAAHGIPARIRQTATIVFGLGRRGERLMADAIGIPAADLDAYAYNAWTPEEQDQINLFMAVLIHKHAAGLPVYAPQQKRELLYLAEQYEAPRHPPTIPPGAERSDVSFDCDDDSPHASLDDMSAIPEQLREQWRELLSDE
jgi:hypothetical protein